MKLSNRYKVPRNFLMEILNAVFKNVPEKILLIAKNFWSMCKSIIKFFFKTTPPNCSSGHAQCPFDKFSKNFLPVDWNFFGQPPKNILRTFSSPKCSFVDTKCSSYILIEKNWEKVWTFFAQCPKEIILLSKKLLSSKFFCGHIECSYDNPSERKKLHKSLKFNRPMSRNGKKTSSNRKIFPECSFGHLEGSLNNFDPKFCL